MLIDKMKTKIVRFRWKAPDHFGVSDTSYALDIPIWGSDYVIGIFGRVVTAFTGITGPVTMQMGTAHDTDCMMETRDLSMTGEFFIHLPSESWYCVLLLPQHRKHSRYDMDGPLITFSSASGNLKNLTAGEVELVVVHVVPDE